MYDFCRTATVANKGMGIKVPMLQLQHFLSDQQWLRFFFSKLG